MASRASEAGQGAYYGPSGHQQALKWITDMKQLIKSKTMGSSLRIQDTLLSLTTDHILITTVADSWDWTCESFLFHNFGGADEDTACRQQNENEESWKRQNTGSH